MKTTVLFVATVLLLAGCSHDHGPDDNGTERVQRTVWTNKSELFLEHDRIVPGKEAQFLIHLTKLEDMKPPAGAGATITFASASGQAAGTLSFSVDPGETPGIFKKSVTLSAPGTYSMTLSVRTAGFSDDITIHDIDASGEGAAGEGPGGISFTKEQQWAVDFMVRQPDKRAVVEYFSSAGELVPASGQEVTISSPLAGTVAADRPLPPLGAKVANGSILAEIEPPLQRQGGLGDLTAVHAEAKMRYHSAKNEQARAQRLYEAKAAPKKRLDEADLALAAARAALDPLEKAMASIQDSRDGNRLLLRAPIAGTVVELAAAPGRHIEAGQPVARILNAEKLWLKAHVPAAEIGRLRSLREALFTVPGLEGEFRTLRPLGVSDAVDPATRTVAVVFEVDNRKRQFKAGMYATVSLAAGSAASALVVPESALFEDEAKYFAFVQIAGESFERREVRTGLRGRGHVQVLAGLEEKDRVVTRGGYYVKLASLSSRLPQGHGHDH